MDPSIYSTLKNLLKTFLPKIDIGEIGKSFLLAKISMYMEIGEVIMIVNCAANLISGRAIQFTKETEKLFLNGCYGPSPLFGSTLKYTREYGNFPSSVRDTLASYPGSDYVGAEKRAWYILHAHALNFQRILWICILSVFLRV